MACERMACPIGSREQGAAGKPPPWGGEIISDPSKRSKISCKMAAGRAVHFQKRRRRGGGGSGRRRKRKKKIIKIHRSSRRWMIPPPPLLYSLSRNKIIREDAYFFEASKGF